MRIAVISKKIPQPDRASGCNRLFLLLEFLAKTNTVDFFPLSKTSADFSYRTNLEKINVNINEYGGRSFLASIFVSNYDAVLFEFYETYIPFLHLVKRYQPLAVVIVDSVDIHFVRHAYEANLGRLGSKLFVRLKTRELCAYRNADITIVVSSQDREILKAEADVKIEILTNINPIVHRVHKKRDHKILFVAGFGHQPNCDALAWFLTEIWPLILARKEEACFIVVGPGLKGDLLQKLASLKNCFYLGYQHDLSLVCDECSICVAPLTYGSGVKGKVTDAMARGLPLVTTSIGVQGIKAINGIHCYIADNASQFADSVLSLLDDHASQVHLSQNSQDLAKYNFSIDAALKDLDRIIDAILAIRSKKAPSMAFKSVPMQIYLGDLVSFTCVAALRKAFSWLSLLPPKVIRIWKEVIRVVGLGV